MPGGFDAVKYIIFTIVFAPLAAGLLNLIPAHGFFALVSAAAVIAGRFLLLQPSVPLYYRGEYLVIGGFGFFFVSRLMQLAKEHDVNNSIRWRVAMFSSGLITAPILHLSLRAADKVQNESVILVLIAVGAVSALLSAHPLWSALPKEKSSGQKPSFAAGFSIFLIIVPLHFIFQWALKPEILAGITDKPYPDVVLGINIALCYGAVLAFISAASRSALRSYRILGALSLASTLIWGLLFNLPFGTLSFVLILFVFITVTASLSPVLTWFTVRAVRCRSLFLGFGTAASVFTTLGLSIYFLEHHNPTLNWYLPGFLTVGLIILAIAGKSAAATPAKPKIAPALAIAVIICVTIYGIHPAKRAVPDARRKVVASLYTWYGAPGKPFGEFGLESLVRPAVELAWSAEKSPIKNVKPNVANSLESIKRLSRAEMDCVSHLMAETDFVSFAGFSDGKNKNSLIISSAADTNLLNTKSRDYFNFSARFDGKRTTATFYIRKDGVKYAKNLQPCASEKGDYEIVFPLDFKSVPSAGPNEMGFQVACSRPGLCQFALSDLKVSNWKHWDYNNMAAKVAGTHNPRYDGRPWPEIAPEGYYDSWDPRVVRSQLQLMEKAGLDGVMIMHPADDKIVQLILDTLDDLNSPLQILYYGGYSVDSPDLNVEIIKKFGSHPRFMKVGGRPVWVIGPTGFQEKPHKIYERELKKLLEMTGAFLVADQYVPPKEEMLPLLDGHFYYDTAGLYRALWGGTNIEVARPDGAFVTGRGHLDIIFRAVSKMLHARNQLFIATVIPGFNSTVKRHDGATYAETWKAAIRSGADWVCIASWNEEGGGIEPTKEHGVFYVKETRLWADAFRAGKAAQ